MGNQMSIKTKLIIMNFLQFAVWGAYLTSQGRYLAGIGFAERIGWFYSVQGIVSIFMPAIICIIADKWVQAQKMYGICHFISALAMIATGAYGVMAGDNTQFATLFTIYTISVAFYMPTLSLSYSVAYSALEKKGLDPIASFPPIRVWGTVGFICTMWAVDLLGFQANSYQYITSGLLGLVLGAYAFTLPACAIDKNSPKKSFAEQLGLKAFTLFKDRRMAIFFIFSMLLGVALQVTNSFANPFLGDFGNLPQFADTFGVKHSNMLISLSQISETLCILLIPFCLRKFGIKKVMIMAMLAWVLRFALFAAGNPGPGLWMLVLSMIVYGIAFDFFNISGSLFINQNTDHSIKNSAQGLFTLMTNGIGAAIGTISAQWVVNKLVNSHKLADGTADWTAVMSGWSESWYIFAAYSLLIAILFALLFAGQPRGAVK